MKLPKYIRTNWYYINRKVIFVLSVFLVSIFFCANLALNLIEYIFN